MSTIPKARPAVSPSDTAKAKRHKKWIVLCVLAGIGLAVALAIYGAGYYVLPAKDRLLSPLHRQLKPSGALGHPIGIGGGALLCLMFLYPLRKKWRWLSKHGKTKNWLDYHILMGLTIPVALTFHSALKLQGIAGAAYYVMLAVVASGIVGRYLYRRIPRKLGAVEMSLEEIQQQCAALARELHSQNLLAESDLQPLLALPSAAEVRGMSLPKALFVIIRLDLRRALIIPRLRRKARSTSAARDELRRVLRAAKRQASLSKDALFLSRIQRMFHLWHVVHRPFSYSLVVFGLLHITVVVYLGFY